MPKTRFVPGVGPAEFPDDMSEVEIQGIIGEQAYANPPVAKAPPLNMQINPPDPRAKQAGGFNPMSAQMGMGLQPPAGDVSNPALGLADMASGAMQGGPLGAATSLMLGQIMDPGGKRNAKEVLMGGAGAGAGSGITGAIFNRLTGGKASGFAELAKAIGAGYGQKKGEELAGANPGDMPIVSQGLAGIPASLLQGVSNKLNKAPRLVSNDLVKQMLEGRGISPTEVFNKTSMDVAGKPIRELRNFAQAKAANPAMKGLQTQVKQEFRTTLSGAPSTWPQKFINKMVPKNNNVNAKAVGPIGHSPGSWDVLKRAVPKEAYEYTKDAALMEVISRHFDSVSGELQPSLMSELSRANKNNTLTEMFGTKEKAQAVVEGLENLIKAQRAIYKAAPGEQASRLAGALTGGPVQGAYQGMRFLNSMRNPGVAAFNESVPNLSDLAMGITKDPGKYAKTLQWLAKHGATAPNSLVRAAVATLNTGDNE